MSSKITTVYNDILSVLQTIYTEKTRILDAYNLSNNPEPFLRDGYGIKVGRTTVGEAEICSFRDDHLFTVVLAREVIRLDSDTTPIDVDVLALLEDCYEGRERFFRVDKIGAGTSIENIQLGDISAVQTFFGNSKKYLSVSYDFIVQVREDLQ